VIAYEMAKEPRKPIPREIEAALLSRSRRRCPLCYYIDNDVREKHGQIAHLDNNPGNASEDNLAFLCIAHHSVYDSTTSQHKNYTHSEVKAYRDRLYQEMARNADDTYVRPSGNKSISIIGMAAGVATLVVGALLGWHYTALAPSARQGRPLDEKLPGFASGMMVQTSDNIEVRRKYQFDFHTPDGAKVAFYLSASNRYAFSVTDIHGEPYILDIPLGGNGIPFGKWAYIFCEVGVASSYTYLRALVDGKEVARREFDCPLDLGNRRWLLTLGADSGGNNGGSFYITQMGAYSTTLNDDELMALAKNALQASGLDTKP
jgi:hypothetical protein